MTDDFRRGRNQMAGSAICDPEDDDRSIKERAERLRLAVRLAGGNTRVAQRAGMPVGTLTRYLAGRDMKASAMIALARACSVSLDWLAEGVGEADMAAGHSEDTAPVTPAETVGIKYLDVHSSRGPGNFSEDLTDAPILDVPKRFVDVAFHRGMSDFFMMRLMGNFMEPTIRSGEVIFIDRSRSASFDGIFAVIFSGIFMIRRLTVRKEGLLTLSSDNESHESGDHPIDRVRWELPHPDADMSNLFIVGRVAYRLQFML